MDPEGNLSSRRVLFHGAVYTASRLLNQGAAFLLLPLYAHLLGSRGVGVIETLAVARTFLGIVLAQGLDAAWFRLRFQMEGKDERDEFESTVFWYLAASSAVGLCLLWAFGGWLGPVLTPGVPFMPLGFWSACTAVGLLFATLLERKLQAEQRPLAFAVFGLIRTLVTTHAVVVFVAILRRGADGKIEAEALAALGMALWSAYALRPRPRWSAARLGGALAYGLPVVPHSLAWFANNMLDRFLVNALLSLQAVGVYSMGYRIAGVGMMVAMAVNQAFGPMFIEAMRGVERDEAEGRHEAANAGRAKIGSIGFFTVIVGCIVVQLITGTAREVLIVATTKEFSDSWRVIAPVSGGVVAWTWYATLSQSVIYRPGTVRLLPIITGAAAVANAALNLVLIPRLGIDGAACATLLSNTVMAVLAYVFGMRSLPLPYAWAKWARVTCWTAFSLAVLWALDALVSDVLRRAAIKAAWLALALPITLLLSGTRFRALADLWKHRARSLDVPEANG